MFSGPRNISTAMMRSWGNRTDTVVIDEPFYAFYLRRTGKLHPGSTEIVSQSQTDVYKIITDLLAPLPPGKTIFYQKHMAHHLLPEIDRSWLDAVTNCFLIRDPAEVINSYIRKHDDPTMEDLGFAQQAELFESVRRSNGAIPSVIDARDVLQNPRRTLDLLCRSVGLEFDEAMLSWPPGLRETDGIWAKYWYTEVAQSTSFQPYRPKSEAVPARLQKLCDQCREYYQELWQYRLR
jgi:Sulfotransferase domain